MARIISFTSQQDGIGKTTAILHLGFSLSRRGKAVLLIDCAPEGSAGMAGRLGIAPPGKITPALHGEAGAAGDSVVFVREKLLAFAVLAAGGDEDPRLPGKTMDCGELGGMLRGLAQRFAFDYVLIDTPPGSGKVVEALLAASDGYVPMIKTLQGPVRAIPRFFNHAERVLKKGIALPLEGVAVSMYAEQGGPGQYSFSTRLYAKMAGDVFFDASLPVEGQFDLSEVHAAPVAFLPEGLKEAAAGPNLAWDLRPPGRKKSAAAADHPPDTMATGEADAAPRETAIHNQQLQDVLREFCDRHALQRAVVADEMGFALADYNISAAEADALAAYTPVIGDFLARAASFLELQEADTLSLHVNQAEKYVFRRFNLHANSYYLSVVSPRQLQVHDAMTACVGQIVQMLAK
jgi:chromosome partitioning protein